MVSVNIQLSSVDSVHSWQCVTLRDGFTLYTCPQLILCSRLALCHTKEWFIQLVFVDTVQGWQIVTFRNGFGVHTVVLSWHCVQVWQCVTLMDSFRVYNCPQLTLQGFRWADVRRIGRPIIASLWPNSISKGTTDFRNFLCMGKISIETSHPANIPPTLAFLIFALPYSLFSMLIVYKGYPTFHLRSFYWQSGVTLRYMLSCLLGVYIIKWISVCRLNNLFNRLLLLNIIHCFPCWLCTKGIPLSTCAPFIDSQVSHCGICWVVCLVFI